MKTIDNFNFAGKKALIRVDFNVPLDENFKVTDNTRIEAAKPTIEKILKDGGTAVLMSHLGRPKGERNDKYSLRHIVSEVEKVLGKKVIFVDDCVGEVAEKAVAAAPAGSVVLLENLRYHNEEEKGDENFSKQLAKLGDIYVNDAFGTAHRAHASTDALPRLLPSAMGLLVEQEIENLKKVQENPLHPVLLIIGGAKVKDKSPLIEHFASLSDYIFVGGKIAADGFTSDLPQITVATDFTEDESGAKLDIGPKSLDQLIDLVLKSHTIIWNGTLGLTEKPPFDFASRVIAESIGAKNLAENLSVICGGDTTGFVENLLQNRYSDQTPLNFSLVSTGGGASLEFLIHGTLPGLEVLKTE